MKNPLPPVVIGAGLAGLSVALSLAPRPVIVLARKPTGQESSSVLAQGGIAAAMGRDDSPFIHELDTLAAGAGLCDPAVVRMITEAAPAAIRQLAAWGTAFDRDEQTQLDLGLEGAHSRRRIVHANGDSTGAAVIEALYATARKTPSITFIDDAGAAEITTDENGVTGVSYTCGGTAGHIAADHVVLATGGIGALWPHTTNPVDSWGQGLALAARAGAELRDLEFVQFHPTGIDAGLDPTPLASESLRGEGAVLINDRGENFMADEPRGALEPRDVVTRAIWEQLQQGRRVFLDTRRIADFAVRFPSVYALCAKANVNPVREPIPVRPVAHYHMGGVAVDFEGRTNIEGLWACGEVAATGLHGANRLASNSLLEATVYGQRIAASLTRTDRVPSPRLCAPPPNLPLEGGGIPLRLPRKETSEERQLIRDLMETHVGVLRDKAGLEKAVDQLSPLAKRSGMALVGQMIAMAALCREESRGAHARTDFPETSRHWQQSNTLALNDKGEPVVMPPSMDAPRKRAAS
ncbi:MAG: L-aspartate oxidase [Alphaproteobacteria bacterium]|nr:L-aspartate oxidase [Alphaproteobacteria bacterium]